MPSPNTNFTEMIVTTIRNRQKKFADNVSNSNALLQRLNAKGNVKMVAGGRSIVEELEYAENSTFMYYSGYEALDISPSEVFTAAEFDWIQASVVVSASGLETRIQNSGPEAMIPLFASRIRNAERSMTNKLSEGVFSDGTGDGGKQVDGLQAAVADDPTMGEYGGIDRSVATNAFWRNQTSGDVSNLDSVGIIRSEMKDMWIECTRGNDKPDLIVADQTLYNLYWESLTEIQRITQPNEGVGGFDALKFRSADVVYDGDSGIAENHMYFLNTDYLHWKVHRDTNMVPMDSRESVNQDAMVVPILWAGNLTCSNASLQGVIFT